MSVSNKTTKNGYTTKTRIYTHRHKTPRHDTFTDTHEVTHTHRGNRKLKLPVPLRFTVLLDGGCDVLFAVYVYVFGWMCVRARIIACE